MNVSSDDPKSYEPPLEDENGSTHISEGVMFGIAVGILFVIFVLSSTWVYRYQLSGGRWGKPDAQIEGEKVEQGFELKQKETVPTYLNSTYVDDTKKDTRG
jgi:hypothetical protein